MACVFQLMLKFYHLPALSLHLYLSLTHTHTHTELTINLSFPVSPKNLSTLALPPILSLFLRLQAAPTCRKSQGDYGDVFVMWSFLLLKNLTLFFNLNMSSPFLPLTQ